MPKNPKIFWPLDAPAQEMRYRRGTTYMLVGQDDGVSNVDLHMNVINADSGLGPYHYHESAENIYFVLSGRARVIVDGVEHFVEAGQVAYIPNGVPHAAGSDGTGPVTVLEIYAPAGKDFHILAEVGTDEYPAVSTVVADDA